VATEDGSGATIAAALERSEGLLRPAGVSRGRPKRLPELPKRLRMVPKCFRSLRNVFRSIRHGFRSIRIGFRSIRNGFRSVRNGFRSIRIGFRSIRNDFRSIRNGFRSTRNGFRSTRHGFRSIRNDFGSIRDGFRSSGKTFGASGTVLARTRRALEGRGPRAVYAGAMPPRSSRMSLSWWGAVDLSHRPPEGALATEGPGWGEGPYRLALTDWCHPFGGGGSWGVLTGFQEKLGPLGIQSDTHTAQLSTGRLAKDGALRIVRQVGGTYRHPASVLTCHLS